jgi:iron complex transport system substrate-binding protein
VAAAKPDLIITEPSRHVSVEQLEKIAPTVSIDHLQGSAPRIYRKLAQLTGTQPRLAILERRYQEQIAQLKAMVDTQNIVSVIQANNGKVTVHHAYHALGRVLRDAGFRFPPLIDGSPMVSALTSALNSCRSWMPILSLPPGGRIPAVSRRMSCRRWKGVMPGWCDFMRACRTGRYILLPREEVISNSYAALSLMVAQVQSHIAGRPMPAEAK